MRVKALLLAAAAVAALSACGTETPVATPTGAGITPTGAPAGNASGDRDSCLVGTWAVDVADVGRQAAAKVGNGGAGSGSGTLTVAFGDQMKITYGNTITLDMPIAGKTAKMTSTFSGEAVSNDWKTKDGKVSGTMSTNNVTNSAVATVDGVTVPTATSVPFGDAINLTEAVNYTCSGSSATMTGQGGITWKLTKK